MAQIEVDDRTLSVALEAFLKNEHLGKVVAMRVALKVALEDIARVFGEALATACVKKLAAEEAGDEHLIN